MNRILRFETEAKVPRALIALMMLLAMGAAIGSHHSAAEEDEEEGSREGTILNVSGPVMPWRGYLSSSTLLSVEMAEAALHGQPNPLELGAAAGSGGAPASAQQVPFRNPAPAFSRNLLISRNYGYAPFQTEPTIAVDPLDPDHLIMGTIDYNMGSGMSTYTSFDAGETWQGPFQVQRFRDDVSSGGDPVVTFDQDGSAYITMISIGVRDFQLGSIGSEATVLNMAVSKSTDGGLTWSDPALASEGQITTVSQVDDEGKERGTITFVDLDKPWITTGPDPDNPDNDVLYLSYTEFEATYSLMYSDEIPYLSQPIQATTVKVVSSADSGRTWSEPVAASPRVLYGFGATSAIGMSGSRQSGEAALVRRAVQGSQVAVAPDGTLVVAYYDSTDDGNSVGLATVMVVTSDDRGSSFTDPVVAGATLEVPRLPRTATFRYGSLPSMTIGPEGEIYVVQSGRSILRANDDSDVFMYKSFDLGVTWQAPVRVNQDDTSGNQFFPTVAVSPDGTVNVMWGDTRDDPTKLRYHIYYTQSTDKGETFGFELPDQDFTAPDTRVTDFASNPMKGFPGGRFIGDYFGMATTADDVYLVWADTRLGEYGGYGQNIGFARKTAIEAPSLFISPPSGSAGRTVDIQGFGFQSESQIQLYVSGVSTAVLRTDDKGQFQTSIYMPLTGEGPTQISAFDETGNVATASFYTEFGFDTLQESLDSINEQLGNLEGTPEPTEAPSPVSGGLQQSQTEASATPTA